jgi:hypothetical protein
MERRGAIEGAVKGFGFLLKTGRGAETLPHTEIVGAGGSAVAACASETGGSSWRLRRAPTSVPRRSAAAGKKERATAAVSSADGPAQKEEGEKACARAGSAGTAAGRLGRLGRKEGWGKKMSFLFSNLIFQIHFPKFLKLF